MTFFLIVPSVMVVTCFLVHAICNRLGLRIHFLTLVMAAFLAIAANLGALAWTNVPDKFYFIKLGGIIFFAAAVTTATNYFLVKRETEAAAEFSEQVKLAYQKSEVSSPKADEKIPEPETVPEVKEAPEVEKKVSVSDVEKIAEKVPEAKEKIPEVKKVSEEILHLIAVSVFIGIFLKVYQIIKQ